MKNGYRVQFNLYSEIRVGSNAAQEKGVLYVNNLLSAASLWSVILANQSNKRLL